MAGGWNKMVLEILSNPFWDSAILWIDNLNICCLEQQKLDSNYGYCHKHQVGAETSNSLLISKLLFRVTPFPHVETYCPLSQYIQELLDPKIPFPWNSNPVQTHILAVKEYKKGIGCA